MARTHVARVRELARRVAMVRRHQNRWVKAASRLRKRIRARLACSPRWVPAIGSPNASERTNAAVRAPSPSPSHEDPGQRLHAGGAIARQVFGLRAWPPSASYSPPLPGLVTSASGWLSFPIPLRGSSGLSPDSREPAPRTGDGDGRVVLEGGRDGKGEMGAVQTTGMTPRRAPVDSRYWATIRSCPCAVRLNTVPAGGLRPPAGVPPSLAPPGGGTTPSCGITTADPRRGRVVAPTGSDGGAMLPRQASDGTARGTAWHS
jgi:hypothetical protein